jgi:hypothetical protein
MGVSLDAQQAEQKKFPPGCSFCLENNGRPHLDWQTEHVAFL